MIKGDYKKLDDLTQHNLCAEHKKPLTVAWDAEESCYALRCGDGHYPDSITRQLSFHQELRQGKREEEQKAIETRRRHESEEAKKLGKPNAVTFPGVPATDLATGELLPLDLVKNLIAYARSYGLDPRRNHVVIMYGKPYFTIDGYLDHANKENVPYSLTGRPLDDYELAQRGYKPDDLGYIAYLKRLDTGQEFEGVGFITKEETTEVSKKKPGQLRYPIVAEKPGQMVQKRAEWQALRRGFPIGEKLSLEEV